MKGTRFFVNRMVSITILLALLVSGCTNFQWVERPPTAPVAEISSIAIIAIPGRREPRGLLDAIAKEVSSLLVRDGGYAVPAADLLEHNLERHGLKSEDVQETDAALLANALEVDAILILEVIDFDVRLGTETVGFLQWTTTAAPYISIEASLLDLRAGETTWWTSTEYEEERSELGPSGSVSSPGLVGGVAGGIVRDLVPRRAYEWVRDAKE